MTILFSQQFEIAQPDGSKQAMPAPEWMFSFVQDEDKPGPVLLPPTI